MREAHDVHQPEDEREPRRHEEQEDAVNEPIEQLRNKHFHAR
jgi:hypothetical protein